MEDCPLGPRGRGRVTGMDQTRSMDLTGWYGTTKGVVLLDSRDTRSPREIIGVRVDNYDARRRVRGATTSHNLPKSPRGTV